MAFLRTRLPCNTFFTCMESIKQGIRMDHPSYVVILTYLFFSFFLSFSYALGVSFHFSLVISSHCGAELSILCYFSYATHSRYTQDFTMAAQGLGHDTHGLSLDRVHARKRPSLPSWHLVSFHGIPHGNGKGALLHYMFPSGLHDPESRQKRLCRCSRCYCWSCPC